MKGITRVMRAGNSAIYLTGPLAIVTSLFMHILRCRGFGSAAPEHIREICELEMIIHTGPQRI